MDRLFNGILLGLADADAQAELHCSFLSWILNFFASPGSGKDGRTPVLVKRIAAARAMTAQGTRAEIVTHINSMLEGEDPSITFSLLLDPSAYS